MRVPLRRIAVQARHEDAAVLANRHVRPLEALATTSSKDLGLCEADPVVEGRTGPEGILYTEAISVEDFQRWGRGMALTSDELLANLPDTFRYSEALRHVSERQLRRLIGDELIVSLSRGVYRKRDWLGDEDLIEIVARAPRATICLRSALARHNLIDDIPAEIDVAVPRGSWTPVTTAPARWRHFDPGTFEIGRDRLDIGGDRSIGVYSAERSIIDAFRMRHLEGVDLANEALKRWLRHGGQPSELLRGARPFPRAVTALREAMEILL